MRKPGTSDCKICGGNGFVIVRDKAVDCECIKQRRRDAAYDTIGIPRHLRSINIGDFEPKQDATGVDHKQPEERQKHVASVLVSQYCDQVGECLRTGNPFELDPTLAYERDSDKKQQPLWRGHWVILSGEKSTGKSLLVVIIAKAAVAAGGYPRILQWADVLDACYDFQSNSSYDALGVIFEKCSPILIENVDQAYEDRADFGSEFGSTLHPITKRRLDVLFSPVYSKSLPVVFTTSRKPPAIKSATESLGPLLGSILQASAVIELPSREHAFNMTVLNAAGGAK
jgi:hypothetical protein